MWYFRRFLIVLLLALCIPGISYAARDRGKAFSLIRDAEIEKYLKDITTPIFRAAGLAPQNVQTYIINDDSINAFVAGGQNMFFHTGLIQQAKDATVISGVAAHEAGHIAGGHLIRKGSVGKQAMMESTLGYILGIASVAAGAPAGAAGAIIGGSQQYAERNFLKYSRQYEEAADQSGLNSLQKVGVTPRGLMSLLNTLQKNSPYSSSDINPYQMTHPVTNERIDHIRTYLQQHPDRDYPVNGSLQHRHERVVAKLNGFLKKPSEVIVKLGAGKASTLPQRYELAIAYFRYPDMVKALSMIDQLIKEEPNDPYFHELRGQMLFENGRIREAIPSYRTALKLAPASALMQTELALAMISTEDDSLLPEAERLLKGAVAREPKNSFAWQQLGIALGRMGMLADSYLSLAEAASLGNDREETLHFISLAKPHIKPGTPQQQQLEELRQVLKRQAEED